MCFSVAKSLEKKNLFLFFLRFKTSRAVRNPCFSLNCVSLKFTRLTCHWRDVSQSVTQKCHVTPCDVTAWQKGTRRTTPMGCQAWEIQAMLLLKKKPQGIEGGTLHADIQYCWILHFLKGFLGAVRLSLCLIINQANLSLCFCIFYPVAPHSLEFPRIPGNPFQNFCRLGGLWHGGLSYRSALLCIWDCCMHKQGLFRDHSDNVTCCKSQFQIWEGFWNYFSHVWLQKKVYLEESVSRVEQMEGWESLNELKDH